ncbi:hypothetical protein HK100_008258 [Physocladia obscura]|uniref:Major facilitator superfamily (MFS) profile domain-containing protein n=1 Tax=Physocladia obscura TaxID=109957 RepID=A0AAD5TB16_9FUNG|nr:hypothetical protein HK100_008258 [Physocladia obscura]
MVGTESLTNSAPPPPLVFAVQSTESAENVSSAICDPISRLDSDFNEDAGSIHRSGFAPVVVAPPQPPFSVLQPNSWRWNIQKTVANPLMVIVPLFFHVLAGGFGGFPVAQFFVLAVCAELGPPDRSPPQVNFSISVDLPDDDYKACAARADVQTRLASWNQTFALTYEIPAFFLIPLMGLLVDRLGRKTMMAIPIFSSILHSCAVVLVSTFNLSLWYFVAVKFVQGFLGGFALLGIAINGFIADTCPVAQRTQTFLTLEIAMFTAMAIGPVAGGFLYRVEYIVLPQIGLYPIFVSILCTDVMLCLYIVFLLPETLKLPSSAQADGEAEIEVVFSEETPESFFAVAFRNFVDSWRGSLDILTTPGRGSSLKVLALIAAVSSVAMSGYGFMFSNYPAQKFGWDAYDFGVYALCKTVCRLFYLSVGFPIFLKYFVGKRNSIVDKTRAELTLVRYGFFTNLIGLICHGLAREAWVFFPLLLYYTSSNISGPTLRSMLSRSVPASSQGSLFAALELLQSGMGLISQVFMPAIYRFLVRIDMPHIIFFVVASIWAVALLLTAWLKSRELIGVDDRNNSDNDDVAVVEPLLNSDYPDESGSRRDLRVRSRTRLRRTSRASTTSLYSRRASTLLEVSSFAPLDEFDEISNVAARIGQWAESVPHSAIEEE